MFSQTLEYALRAMVCLAQRHPDPVTNQQLSQATKVPGSYLSKVLQTLGRADLIHATRGLGGGYVLKADPAEITIFAVVDAIDPIKRITTCPLGIGSHGANLCPLHHRMDRVLSDAEDAFRRTTLAEMVNDPTRSTPLCETRMVQIGKK